ncbi:MAG: acyltransferase [Vicinamibacterales bacterium]
MTELMPTGRFRQLDGLRAIAVGGVMVQHGLGLVGRNGGEGGFALGSVGVRLFFVLSGFLITGILLQSREDASQREVSRWHVWRAFYCRRALRILPLGYAVMVVAWLAGSPSIHAHPWMFATYTSNFFVAAEGLRDPSLDHFWSLAIEEQFYLFWPLIILAVPERWLVGAMTAVVLLAMVARAELLIHAGVHAAYVSTPSRLDAMAIGGLLAFYRRRNPGRTNALLVGLVAAGVLARLVGRFLPDYPVVLPLPETGYVLLSAALVLWAASGIRGPVGRVLASRPMVAIGTISYGIYVYHMVIAGLAPSLQARFALPFTFPPHEGWERMLWMIGTTLPVAAASWRWFERPLNDLKSRFPYIPKVD